MSKSAFALACLFTIFWRPYEPQSAANLSAKYPVVTSYEVRPGILMTPKFTSEGEVCEMSFERQRATRSGVFLGSMMSDALVQSIEDELAPTSERGKPTRWMGVTVSSGGGTGTSYDYENINIRDHLGWREGRERVVVIRWKNRTCKKEPEPLPLEEYPH